MTGNQPLSGATTLAGVALIAVLLAGFPAGTTAQQGSRSAKYFEDALARIERNDAAGAIVQLKNALREDPNMLAAHVLMGKALLATGDAAAAEGSFAKALQLGVDRSEIVLPMAQALLDQGKFQALLERFPADGTQAAQRAELLVLRGHAYRGLGDLKSAAAAFEAARAADPRSVSAALSLAEVLLQQGKRADAEKLVDQALKQSPADERLSTLRGTLALARGDVAAALAGYSKALAARPGYFNARMARALLLVDLGRTEEAAPDVAQLAKDRPQDPRVNNLRAQFFAKRGDEQGARDAHREVTAFLDAVPRDTLRQRTPALLLLGGIAHFALQQREKARTYLEDFLRVEPRHAGARKLLGSILLAEGNTPRAVSELEEALRLAPRDPEIHALIAAAYSNRRQYHTATRYLDQALKLSGGAPAMHAAMGLGLLGQGRMDLGVEHLEQALAKDPGNQQASVALAVAYLKRGQTKKAVEVAERLVTREPKNVAAQNLLGIARVAADDRKGARAAYETAIQIDQSFVAARLNLARLDLADGRHEAARGKLQAVLKERPRDTQAMLELAAVEEAAGRIDDAIRWLEKARALQRRNAAATARLVALYLRTRNADKALSVAKDAEAVAPEDPIVLAALGQALLAVGNEQTARVVFSRMSRLATADPAALVDVARLQLTANDAKGAAYSAEKALAVRPDSVPAQALMAEIDLRSGDFVKAEQRARAIATSHPGSPLGHRLLADAAMARGNYPQAIEGYRNALNKDPSTDGALRLYRAYLQSGAAAKGIEFMQTWVKDRPDDVVALRALAEGQLATGNLRAARTGYEEVLKLRGEDAVLLNNLANVLARQGDRGALAYAERAYRLAPNDAAIQDTLGWILVEQGRLQDGLRHLREARLRNPQSPEIRYHLASALTRAGRKDEARQELAPALKAGREFASAENARKLWAELNPR